jgi:hypothetical protein
MKIPGQAFEAARTFKSLTEAQTEQLLSRTARAAAHGEYELFKTSDRFDSTALHPEWLGQLTI